MLIRSMGLTYLPTLYTIHASLWNGLTILQNWQVKQKISYSEALSHTQQITPNLLPFGQLIFDGFDETVADLSDVNQALGGTEDVVGSTVEDRI